VALPISPAVSTYRLQMRGDRFASRLRGQIAFESVDALVEQIARDVVATASALAVAKPSTSN
jgi:FAD synthase